MSFRTICAFKYVPVRDDAIAFDEETAAARQLFAAGVKSLYRDCGGFNAANEFREKILRRRQGAWDDQK
jgi:hypothetical protein